jgi:hypothetical protein
MLYNENPTTKLQSITKELVNANLTDKKVYVIQIPNTLLINIAPNFEYILFSFIKNDCCCSNEKAIISAQRKLS